MGECQRTDERMSGQVKICISSKKKEKRNFEFSHSFLARRFRHHHMQTRLGDGKITMSNQLFLFIILCLAEEKKFPGIYLSVPKVNLKVAREKKLVGQRAGFWIAKNERVVSCEKKGNEKSDRHVCERKKKRRAAMDNMSQRSAGLLAGWRQYCMHRYCTSSF